MELMPPLPIENKKRNIGKENYLDKDYFLCTHLLAIFNDGKELWFAFEYGLASKWRLYISKTELEEEINSAYVYQLQEELADIYIKKGHYAMEKNQIFLDSITQYRNN